MTKENKIFNFNSNWNSKFLFAAYRSEKKQLKWILKHKLYNVRWDDNLFEKRDGAIKEYFTPDYILLYDCRDYSKGCRLFKWDGNRTTATEEDMVKLGYPYPDGSYQLYGLGEEYEVPEIYIPGIQNYLKLRGDKIKFCPTLLTGLDIVTAQNVKNITSNGKSTLRFIDLFAGLGGFHHAMEKIGNKWGFQTECVFASELRQDLRKLYSLNYGFPYEEINSDITLLTDENIIRTQVPDHDVLCAGFPCQPFSQAGKREGFEDTAGRGILFNYIADIIRVKRPEFIFLENVANLKNHDEGRTWKTIESRLSNDLDYDVTEVILSPHEFGLPQHRKRIYIVGRDRKKGDLSEFEFPVPPKEKPICHINDLIEKAPTDVVPLKRQQRQYLDIWQQFLDECSKRNVELPHAPIWAMEFGATYSFEDLVPARCSINKLKKSKGTLGKKIKGETLLECLSCLPNYARTDKDITFPDWKKKFIRENRKFYEHNKEWIDPWKEQIKDWENSFIKFEWNCPVDGKMLLDDKIIQFRPSGIRVKMPTYSPALTYVGNQIPIFPWIECVLSDGSIQKGRHMTTKEAAKTQGMEELSFEGLPKNRVYEALGNAVDVDLVKLIIENFIKLGLLKNHE